MPSYSISVLRSDGSSALFQFQPGQITIGQTSGEIATLDPQVADPHGTLHFDGHTLTYTDAGSPSGSFLRSGERVAGSVPLEGGGAIRFGGCTLIVQEIQRDGAVPPSPQYAAPPAPAQAQPVQPSPPVQPPQPVSPQPVWPQPVSPQPVSPQPVSPQPMSPQGVPPAQAAAPVLANASGSASTAHPMPDATGGDVGAQLKHHVSTGVTRYKKHYLNGVLTIGLVVIPAALINAVLGWIPVIGFIVAILVGLAQLLLVPLSAGAMGRWALAAAAGRDLHWKKAWKNALANPVQEWLNVALALLVTTFGIMLLIVPGLIVGMFALPAYLLEGKKFININARSAELVLKDAAGHLGLGLLTILCLIPVALVVALVTLILAFVPLVGGPLTTFLTVALNVFAAPFLYLLWAQIYFASVRRLEGGDPIAGHGPTIDSWSAAQ